MQVQQLPRGATLIDHDRTLWIPCDLNHATTLPAELRPLWQERNILHAENAPFQLSPKLHATVYIMSGMGLMLGDSVIGLSALHWLKKLRPDLCLHVARATRRPAYDYVEQLYRMLPGLLEGVHILPAPESILPNSAVVIDLADTLYRPSFGKIPMIDFWLHGLGIEPTSVPTEAKTNSWLKELELPSLPPPWRDRPYILFCPNSSTPLRTIPPEQHTAWVERISQWSGLPVIGFSPIAHAKYTDVSHLSVSTADFIAWIKHAAALISADSAAVHIAAGFDIPTLAGFTSMDPRVLVRDYPNVRAIDLRRPETSGLHVSKDLTLAAIAAQQWELLLRSDAIPWPL